MENPAPNLAVAATFPSCLSASGGRKRPGPAASTWALAFRLARAFAGAMGWTPTATMTASAMLAITLAQAQPGPAIPAK